MAKFFLAEKLGFAYYVKNVVGEPNTYLAQAQANGAIYRVTPDSTGSLRYGVATRATKKEAQYYLLRLKK